MSPAVVKVYPNGLIMSRPTGGTPPKVQRGKATGWNSQTARRFQNWLMGVDAPALYDQGKELYGFTLTVRETPTSAKEWARLREMWIKRVERRLPNCPIMWITEFQRRGTPHLHGVIAAPPAAADDVKHLVKVDWCEIMQANGLTAKAAAQDVKPLHNVAGWLEYMTKHLSRGILHYQRSTIPAGWETPGRVYGYNRLWPRSEQQLGLSVGGWWQLRRLLHAWAMADAAKERSKGILGAAKAKDRQKYLRRKKRGTRASSAFMGTTEWAPPEVATQLLEYLRREGYGVVDLETGEIVEKSS